MLTRTLATFALAAAAFLAVASAGHAAPAPPRWCGTDEATADRLPDAVASYQLHAVYAIPSDGADRYFQDAPLIARDLAAIDSWWIAQDPTRTLRWDMQAFPGCDSLFGGLDISFLRLPLPASAYADPQNGGYVNLVRGLGASFLDPYKKYAVFYDGPLIPDNDICGVSSLGPISSGASYAFAYLQGSPQGFCGSLGNSDYMAQTAVHEVIHNLGAVSPSAPHVCMGGHVCDSVGDVMAPFGTSNSLFDYVLDVGRDDYYGHSGSWWDVQDSAWLSHLNAPRFPLTVTATGDGKVTSNLPGIECPPACSIPWDSGTAVSLLAETSGDNRFAGWAGACSGDGDTCALTMDAAKSVSARFVAQATMRVVRRGSGSVSSSPEGINCPGSCESLFDVGSSVTLTAKPARGSRVVAWSVRSCGTRTTCSVAFSADATVTITFGPATTRLAVSVRGGGRVTSTPAGISCPTRCAAAFPATTTVRLRPTPSKGWRFSGWAGACHGKGACTVKGGAVRATFSRI
jgi:Divergent InlB B-repeat domain